ncbi:MAG: hypothetical protein P0Y49_13615 [Candidatus Pedobacter colombiensis]|uniref:Uncharacterized protein n=1 Tax=Candidatus Pedobacter colombiensis TaxID=3121371 RepID=A0AAJ6B5T5_9SPHI|nr:hypothetical protein [Pedobacter sp.]WEK17836.1 MAG: hypothetical protein P0Y49_13615 [Pedobacter sp.]
MEITEDNKEILNAEVLKNGDLVAHSDISERVKLIGEFVKEIAESKNLKPSSLGRLINSTKQNVSDIYKRKTIDTELLLTLSIALDYNLFSFYDDKEPIASFRKAETLELEAKVDKLSVELKHTTEKLNLQEDTIRLLKEKEEYLKNKPRYLY